MFEINKQYKTDPTLLNKLEELSKREMTPQEVFKQKVSFVYGQLPINSQLSIIDVENMLIDHLGFNPLKSNLRK